VTTTSLQVCLVTALGIVLAAPIGRRVLQHRFDPFEPIVLFAVAYGVMFVVRPAAMLATHHLAYDGPRSSTDVSGTFTKMLFLAFLGAVAFTAAYETPLGARLASGWRGLSDLATPRVVVSALVIGLVGVGSFVAFLMSSSGLSTLSLIFRGRSDELFRDVEGKKFYLWYSFLLLVPATLVLVAVGLERRRKGLLLVAFLFGALFLLRTVPLGVRFAILPLLGGGFVFAYLRRARRPSVLVLVALALIALVGSAFLSDLRGRGTRGETVAQTIVRSTRPHRIVAPLVSGPDTEMAPVLAAALNEIPKKLHYTYGGTIFGDLVSRPIPRALWSDKPELPRDKLITKLWPIERKKAGINPEFSVLLYFFWDFGFPGVVVGMGLFGVSARALFEYFWRHRYSSAVQLLYSLTLWFVVIGLRNSPVDMLVQFMFVVFPAWIAVRLAPRRGLKVATVASR
jgi:hypothetical protein